jgi:hypothetical protein
MLETGAALLMRASPALGPGADPEKRNVYLGMVVHCTLITISVVLVIVTGQL